MHLQFTQTGVDLKDLSNVTDKGYLTNKDSLFWDGPVSERTDNSGKYSKVCRGLVDLDATCDVDKDIVAIKRDLQFSLSQGK